MTFLPAGVIGHWFYLYLIVDVYSRKIVGFEVHERDEADHAAHLVKRTALCEGIHAVKAKPVLHGDNGATLKATRAGDGALAGGQTVVLAAARERRQRLRREPVPHGQVPA